MDFGTEFPCAYREDLKNNLVKLLGRFENKWYKWLFGDHLKRMFKLYRYVETSPPGLSICMSVCHELYPRFGSFFVMKIIVIIIISFTLLLLSKLQTSLHVKSCLNCCYQILRASPDPI